MIIPPICVCWVLDDPDILTLRAKDAAGTWHPSAADVYCAFVTSICCQAADYDRRVMRPTKQCPLQFLVLSGKAPHVACPERKRICSIVPTTLPCMESRKVFAFIASMMEWAVANEGRIPVPLYVWSRGLEAVFMACTQAIESGNKIVTNNARLAPGIGDALTKARQCVGKSIEKGARDIADTVHRGSGPFSQPIRPSKSQSRRTYNSYLCD